MLLVILCCCNVTIVMFSVEIVVQNGKTPLQLAKESNKHDTVKFLKSYLQEVPTYIITL